MSSRPQFRRRRIGFTLVELIVVLSVIGILATITIVVYGSWKKNTAISVLQSDLNAATSAMENGRNFGSGYPTSVSLPISITDASVTPSLNLTPSANDTLKLAVGSTAIAYCIDGTSSVDSAILYYTDNISTGPQTGTCATRTTVTVPVAPTGLAMTSITDTQISLSWSTATYATSYTTRCATDPGYITGVLTGTTSSTAITFSSASQVTTYYCEVDASDAVGTSSWSSNITVTTAETPLAAPTGLITATASTTQIYYAFNSLSGAASYNVQIGTVAGFGSGIVATNSQTGLTGSFSSLSPSTLYYFRVQAVSSTNLAGAWSTGTVTGATYTNWSVYSKFASVGDWNGDGKNDIIAYKSTGVIDLHLGGGNGTFGPAITLTNIGTTVRDLIGPGTLPSGTAPILWWDNTDGTGHAIVSNGSTGTTGTTLTTTIAGGWAPCTTVFAAPLFYTGKVMIICENSALTEYSLSSSAAATLVTTYGSGWSSSFGVNVFGVGDWSGDGIGDIGTINSSSNAGVVYLGTGTGTTGTTVTMGSGWTTNIVTGGWDFNGDGHADLLRYNTSTGILTYYQGSGTSGGTYPYFTTAGANGIVIN